MESVSGVTQEGGRGHIKLGFLNRGRKVDFLLSMAESSCFNLRSMNLYRKKVTPV